jgi:formate transporter
LSDHQNESGLAAPKPPALAEEVSEALLEKASLPVGTMATLGVLAGSYIALGALFATVAAAGADSLPHGMSQIVAGLVFTLGLVLVIVAGAELFTGNTLMAGLLLVRRLSLRPMLLSWGVVYISNLVGALLTAGLVFASQVHLQGDGAMGAAALELAELKSNTGFISAFASGVLANMLVCLAVWMSYGAKSTSDKLFAVLLPIAAFVAAGLEHSVANMYLIPYAWIVKGFADPLFWEAAGVSSTAFPSISLAGFAGNMIPVMLGNIVGGFIIATAYAVAYWRKPASWKRV